jgi:hypothetical protein
MPAEPIRGDADTETSFKQNKKISLHEQAGVEACKREGEDHADL